MTGSLNLSANNGRRAKDRYGFNKWISLSLALLFSITYGCGAQTSGSTLTSNAGNTASEWTPNSPGIPVADSCTAGDADLDGLCDDVDPDNSNSDIDNDGAPDGLDMTPTGKKGEGKNWFQSLSPLFKFGVIAVGALGTAWLIDGFINDNCLTGSNNGSGDGGNGFTQYCLKNIDSTNTTLSFTQPAAPDLLMKYSGITATVDKTSWIGDYDWGEAVASVAVNYDLKPETDAVSGKEVTVPAIYEEQQNVPVNGPYGILVSQEDAAPCGAEEEGCLARMTRLIAKPSVDKAGCQGNVLSGSGALVTFKWDSNQITMCVDYSEFGDGGFDGSGDGNFNTPVSVPSNEKLGILMIDENSSFSYAQDKIQITGFNQDGTPKAASVPRYFKSTPYGNDGHPLVGKNWARNLAAESGDQAE